MFLVELKKGFSRQSFKVAILIGTIFCILNITKYISISISDNYLQGYIKGYLETTYDNFILFNLTPLSNILILIFPLLSCISYSDSYLEDVQSGVIKFIYTRQSKVKYLISKFLSNFIVAGVSIAVPLMINFIIIILLYPSIPPHPVLGKVTIMDGGLFPDLYYSKPIVYIFMWIVIYFLYAGAFASIGLSLGVIIKNKYITIILPFIVYMVVEIIVELIDKPMYSPQQFLYLSRSQSPYIIICEFAIIFLISITIFLYGGYKNETY